jgi:hypothetical protein
MDPRGGMPTAALAGMADTIMVPPPRLSWSAVFGGAFFAIGIWLLLHLLGLGIGLSAIDPDNPNTLRGAGIGTGIWSLIAPLIALFLGGFVATRVSPAIDRFTGAIHGGIVWALTTVFGMVLLLSALSAVVGTAFHIGGRVLETTAGVVGNAAQQGDAGDTLRTMGVDENELIRPVNERLARQGLPPVTSDQLEAATRDTLRTSVQQGHFDRQTMITSLSEHTAMSPQEADRAARDIENQFNTRVSQVGHDVQRGALQAADTSGPVVLWTFAAMLLGLIAAGLGALLGVRRRELRMITVERGGTVVTPGGVGMPVAT